MLCDLRAGLVLCVSMELVESVCVGGLLLTVIFALWLMTLLVWPH